ncbi:hypothetical protein [Vitiosangium sp. GDMCC 1.1324]|uniref:hypothetical protein n=1 Tax=Vitiosangium sp. (strain GDMCC 1.1324) TaxID=2138576 RepID=UPI001E5D8EAF|nr:hypothetical protein [Vitiosangium sp. GDMCC 1.1324]
MSDRLCECVESFQRDSCIQLAAERERNIEPTAEDLQLCEQKLQTCNLSANDRSTCDILQTEKGKEDCGLAR